MMVLANIGYFLRTGLSSADFPPKVRLRDLRDLFRELINSKNLKIDAGEFEPSTLSVTRTQMMISALDR